MGRKGEGEIMIVFILGCCRTTPSTSVPKEPARIPPTLSSGVVLPTSTPTTAFIFISMGHSSEDGMSRLIIRRAG